MRLTKKQLETLRTLDAAPVDGLSPFAIYRGSGYALVARGLATFDAHTYDYNLSRWRITRAGVKLLQSMGQ